MEVFTKYDIVNGVQIPCARRYMLSPSLGLIAYRPGHKGENDKLTKITSINEIKLVDAWNRQNMQVADLYLFVNGECVWYPYSWEDIRKATFGHDKANTFICCEALNGAQNYAFIEDEFMDVTQEELMTAFYEALGFSRPDMRYVLKDNCIMGEPLSE